MAREVAFLDANISAIEQLRAHLRDGVDAIVLSRDAPALAQIADGIKSHRDIEAIHIIAHGRPGSIEFASGPVGADALDLHADDLAAIGRSLDGGEIRLWACETAKGFEGAAFLAALTAATGASIAASTGLVGAADKGGAWELDVQARPNQDRSPLTAEGVSSYEHVLAPTISNWNAALTPTEQAGAVFIDTNVSIGSWNDSNSGTSLRVSVASAHAGDQLTVGTTWVSGTTTGIFVSGSNVYYRQSNETGSNLGTLIGTIDNTSNGVNGAALQVNLNSLFLFSPSDDTVVTALARAFQFRNTSDSPPSGGRAITLVANDDDGDAGDSDGGSSVNITAVNDAPTAVNFANATTALAENTSTATHVKVADIVVTDPDTQGTNTLSLSGTDAASFEIVGTELFVKAGVTLDFETKSSYSVTVNVNDASVGGNPDASKSYTLNLTDVDEIAPTVTISDDEPGTANIAGGDIVYTFQFSETVTGFDATDVVVNGTKGTFTAVDGDTYTLVVTPAAGFTGNITVDVGAGAANDTAGNPSVAASQSIQAVDTAAPSVSSVAYGTNDGTLSVGEPIELIVNFSEAVTVAGGPPTLTLSSGGTATLVSGSGTTALVFSYTPVFGESTPDLEVTGITLNGATIRDAAGNDADTAGAVTNPPGTVVVDAAIPTVSSVEYGTNDGALATGETIELIVNFSEAVTVAGGTPTLALSGGGTATLVSGSGSSALVFSYTPASGQTTADLEVTGFDLGGATIKDASGNDAVTTGIVTNPAGTVAVDTTTPTVSSVEYGTNDGALAAGEPIELVVNFSEAVTVAGGPPTLALSSGGVATLVSGSGTGSLVFSYTPAGGESTADLEVTGIALNGATIRDAAGNDADTAGAIANPTGTVAVETTAPTVSIVVDDAALISGETSLVTFTFSEAPSNFTNDDVTVGNGTLSQILPTGDPLVFTAILTPDAGVENASNVVTVGTNWTDAAGNPPAASTNSNSYAVDTAAFATISVNPVTADNIINAQESGTTVTITGTVGGDVQNGDIVTITVNGNNYDGTVSGGSFSIEVSGSELAQDTNIHASVTATDAVGNTATGTADRAYQVDLAATATISVNSITADNIINAAEAGGPIAVTGTVGGDAKDGDTVTLTVNGHNYDGTVSGTSFSINVDTADLVLDTNVHASVSATDAAGNTATGTSDHSYQVDLTATATIAVNDITADNIINAAEAGGTVAVTGTVSGDANDGDAVTLTVNGNTYGGTVSGTSFSINVSGADLAAGSSIHASVAATDAAGNPVTAENSKTYSVDTTADQGGNLAVSIPDGLIGNAEKTSVAFSIAGLDPDATATVTFTSSGGGSPVVLAGLTGGGSANLSGLTDGDITVTVSATDAVGNTANGAPAAAVLDTVADQGGDLAVSIADDLVNNAEKANVAFTVTGLDPDATATVTFTSSNGGSPIVLNGVTGSGTANLSGLADGDITVTISATDTAGNHADGAPGATVLDTQADGFVILDPITDDNVINATEAATANIAITGFVGGDAKDGDSVTLTVNGETYTGTVSGSAFSINVKGSDLAADTDTTVDVSVAATDDLGNTTALTSSQAYTVDTTVEAWIVINPITDDNIINTEEAGQTIAVTGQLGPDVADGTIVTLTINSVNYTGEASGGTFSIDVLGSALAGASTVHASVTATDAFGNEATETADQAYTVDLSGAASITLDVIAGDDIINATEEAGLVTLTGTVGGDVQDGDLVTLTVHGSEYVGFVSGNAFSIDVLGTDLALDTNVHASVSTIDSSGNPATATADRAYTVDTTADEDSDLAVSVEDNLVGNAEKTSVAYTVAGLDGDATATVTFTDGTNSVQGVNGVADLSGLTDGPITATVSATDAAGNTAAGASGATVLDTIADEGGDLAVSVADDLVNNAEKTSVAYTVAGLDPDATATITFTSSGGGTAVVLTGVTGNGSADLTGLADGNITVTISVTDTAGNTANGAPSATVLDTTADGTGDLAVSVSDNLVGAAEKTSVAYTVAGLDPDATATVTFTSSGGGTPVVLTGVTGSGSADLTGLADGNVTVTISATDTAGNTATGAPGATVLDTTADQGNDLAVSVSDNLVGAAEKTSVAYTVAGLDPDATATVTFTSSGGGTPVVLTGVTGSGSADLTGLADGNVTVTISATDAAGNTANGAPGATVLDTTADQGSDLAVSVTDDLVGAAEKTSVAYTVAGLDPDATATITFTSSGGGTPVVLTGVTGNGSADLTGLADGNITVTISATDAAGNTVNGAPGATVLDTTADQGNDLAVSVSDNLVGAVEKTSVAYTVAGLDPDASATITFTSSGGGTPVVLTGITGSGSVDLTGLSDGNITVTISATDAAGNTASGAPGATVLDSTVSGDLAVSIPDNLIGDAEKTNVAYTVAGLDPDATATITFTSSGGGTPVVLTGITGSGSVDLSALADGNVTVTISATDTAGNTVAGAPGATVLDTVADQGGDLAVSVNDNLVGAAEKTSVAYTVAGLDPDATATITFTSSGGGTPVVLTGVTGSGSADLTGLADGNITVTISATDTAGNTANGASGATVFDTVADQGGNLAVSLADSLVGNAEKANVAYTVTGLDPDATATITFTSSGGGTPVVLTGITGSGSVDLTSLSDGNVTVTISATDTAGNNANGTSGATVLDTVADQGGNLAVSIADSLVGNAEKANVAYTVAGLDPDATATITFTSSGGGTPVVLTGVTSSGSADLSGLADGNITVTISAADTAGNTANGAPGATVLDTTAAATITIGLVTADNTLSAAEAAGDVSITGTVGGDVENGDTITLTVNGKDYSGTANSGTFSIDVKGSDLAADSDSKIEASVSVTDAAGNTAVAQDTQTYLLALNQAPVITSDGGGTSAGISVPENGTAVTTVTATDPDVGTTLLYSLSGADAGKFQVSSTGVLSFTSAPDFEIPGDVGGNNVYDVVVEVSDGTLTDSQAIAVTVTNVSGNIPSDNNDNILIGTDEEDAINGLGGNDLLRGKLGKDAIDGGTGSDTVDYSDKTAAVVLTLNGSTNATAFVGGVAEDTVKNVENIIGGSGDDTLTGDGAANVLKGGAGKDTLDGGTGLDTVDYSDKTAAVVLTLNGSTNATATVGGVAEDTVRNIENVIGGSADDTLTGDGGANTLSGGNGNDLLTGGAGADALDGGAGSDRVSYQTAAAAVIASLTNAAGNTGDAAGDTYTSIESLTGSNFNDTLTGTAATNSIIAGLGDDTVFGLGGNDSLFGQDGNDVLVGGSGVDALSGGNGSDRASYDTATAAVVASLTNPGVNAGDALGDTYNSVESLTGSAFADTLTGNTGTNSIIGGLGNDKVFGLAGNDNLFGQDGNDILVGGAGADAFSGGVGSDTASYEDATAGILASLVSPAANTGDAAGDTYSSIENLTGSAFADTLTGNNGANVLKGGNGADVLIGGAGADTLDGGAGSDRVSYQTAAAAVIASLTNTAGNTGDAAGDTYTAIESLTGSDFDDTLTGTAATNSIIGGSGNDTVFGLGGNDSLFGQDGNDVLVGGAGADALSGGNGSDRASYDTAAAAVVASLTNPGANTGDALGDTYNSVESLTGSAFADTLTGNTGTNSIIGGLGDDKVFGLAGNDNLFGQDGNDVLVGGIGADAFSGGAGSDTASYEDAASGIIASLISPAANAGDAKGDTYSSIESLTGSAFADTLTGNNGANVINGGNGADLINGGLGNDTLTGGAGTDTYFFNSALNSSTNVDTITDFSVADDTFRLENTGVFTALTATGTLAATAFVVGSAAADALDRIIYNSSTGIVSYDSDGTGANAAIAFAKVTPLTALTNLDFFVV
ncbi:Ig-like domain-containing protein [Mesorhizobium sp. IMUNJ 23232]|uniref:Ig-like domain-containing protein n=1 Tax=Mesorhizobium sp. IMUNJ 23232 TaxID=3376064 RepID=UPI0037AC1EBA